jgi:hypothetical protein
MVEEGGGGVAENCIGEVGGLEDLEIGQGTKDGVQSMDRWESDSGLCEFCIGC